jgi:sigma-B regulation protein RsbU (phosphoserine phosphatase)
VAASTFALLRSLLDEQPQRFAAMANAWLAGGAGLLEIADLQGTLAHWGDPGAQGEALTALICYRREPVGEFKVRGVGGDVAQSRLDADADLIGQLLRLNSEVEDITGELVDAQDQLLALYQINRSAGSQLRLDEAFSLLASEAARLLKADGAFVCLQADRDRPPAIYGANHQAGPHLPVEIQRRLLGAGREQVLDADDLRVFWAGVRNLAYLPITIRGAVVAGGIGLINRPGGFSSPDMKLARAIAEHAGTVLERGMLYQDQLDRTRMQAEMDLARTVQRSLLPYEPPRVGGLDISARSLPALQVGGDFFDFVSTADRPLVITLGDVTGKGIPAALLMAMVRTALRSKANFLPRLDPVKIMERANQDLYADFTEVNMFATVFVGMYEPVERTLYYANAGHSPVIYRPQGGPARLLPADGVPMGVLDSTLCELQTIDLQPGDLLLLATDGFNEAHSPPGELYGIERLLCLVDDLADLPADALAEGMFAAIAAFSAGREQSDDQTLVVIKGAPTP